MNRRVAAALWSLLLMLLLLALTALLLGTHDAVLWLLLAADAVLLVCSGRILRRKPQSPWLGVGLFALTWMVFPLLKPINQELIYWHADDVLMSFDALLWGGQTLPAYFRFEEHPRVADVFSACYFCFFFLVLGSVIYYTVQRRRAAAGHFFSGLLTVYGFGFIGYLLLPAAGAAFYSLPHADGAGGAITQWVTAVVRDSVTGMDVFPSLHTAVTLYVVGFLYIDGRRITALLLTPVALGIIAATIILRYHYGVDVLAGMVLAAVVLYRSCRIIYRC